MNTYYILITLASSENGEVKVQPFTLQANDEQSALQQLKGNFNFLEIKRVEITEFKLAYDPRGSSQS